jgi:hypothetical protein
MELEDIKTPRDILEYMDRFQYGWLDINDEEHIQSGKGHKELYRTSTVEEMIEHNLGTCLEQVILMSRILTKLGFPNRKFIIRVYRGDEKFDYINSKILIHSFVLYYKDGKVFQIEHPDPNRRGIHGFDSEELAIKAMERYYQKFYGGYLRPAVEFFDIPKGLTFDELNAYINTLEEERDKKKELNQ